MLGTVRYKIISSIYHTMEGKVPVYILSRKRKSRGIKIMRKGQVPDPRIFYIPKEHTLICHPAYYQELCDGLYGKAKV